MFRRSRKTLHNSAIFLMWGGITCIYRKVIYCLAFEQENKSGDDQPKETLYEKEEKSGNANLF